MINQFEPYYVLIYANLFTTYKPIFVYFVSILSVAGILHICKTLDDYSHFFYLKNPCFYTIFHIHLNLNFK